MSDIYKLFSYTSDLLFLRNLTRISIRKFNKLINLAEIYCDLPIPDKNEELKLEYGKLLSIMTLIEMAIKQYQIYEDNQKYINWENFSKGLTYNNIYPKLCMRFMIVYEKLL